jgi:hypothetical protein
MSKYKFDSKEDVVDFVRSFMFVQDEEPQYQFETEKEIAEYAIANMEVGDVFSDEEVADHLTDAGWGLMDYARHLYNGNDGIIDEFLGEINTDDILCNIDRNSSDLVDFVGDRYTVEEVYGLDVIAQEIQDNYSVNDIFNEDKIDTWAEQNGYMNRQEEIEEIRVILDLDYDEGYNLVYDMYYQPILEDYDGPIKYSKTILRALRDRQRKLNALILAGADEQEHIRLKSEHTIAETAFLGILSQCRKLNRNG